jgi:hypothetical protein
MPIVGKLPIKPPTSINSHISNTGRMTKSKNRKRIQNSLFVGFSSLLGQIQPIQAKQNIADASPLPQPSQTRAQSIIWLTIDHRLSSSTGFQCEYLAEP